MSVSKWVTLMMYINLMTIKLNYCCDDVVMDQTAYLDDDDNDDNYDNEKIYVEWKTNTTHITMKVTGKTTGWIGVGFSPSGSMKGADIVVGWVKDGKGYLQDYHGKPDRNGRPINDMYQDYTLLSSNENETHTSYCFIRKMNTCDDDDYVIQTGTLTLIYAFHDEDPPNEDEQSLQYHGSNRGTDVQSLIGVQFAKPTGPDVKFIEFRMPNVSIPEVRDTYYWCQFFPLPDLSNKHHMIGYEPIFEEGHKNLMHHLVVYQCVGNNIKYLIQKTSGFECYTPTAPIPFIQCQMAFIAWSIGSKGGIYPENVGFPFLNSLNGQDVYYMFDVHYDNPEKKTGLHDSSGLRIYYTDKLRPNDAACLMVGYSVFNPYLIIPPRQKEFIVPAHCPKECLAAKLDPKGIRVFGFLLHTHLSGKKILLRHFRNGTELPPLASNNNYDFKFQLLQFLNEEKIILPGDSLSLECHYNTEDQNATIIGGESTKDEMCVAFLLYYSVIQLARCNSAMQPSHVNDLIGIEQIYPIRSPIDPIRIQKPYDLNYMKVADYLKQYQWSNEQIAKFQLRVLESDKLPECTGAFGKVKSMNLKTVNYPEVIPYEEKAVCTESIQHQEKVNYLRKIVGMFRKF